MAKRQRIKGKGILEHPQPFPAAIRIGNMVFTSNVFGDDPETHEVPKDLETQCKNVFDAMRRIMEGAGGSVGDIAKVTVTMTSRDDRATMNKYWTAMFPNEDDRPVRHTVEGALAQGRKIQVEFIAVI
jgi:enamine deaminase RidA (YjgF/YER057c/UK114 family)